MANFDPAVWYHLYVNENNESSLIGTNLYDNNNLAGSVFFQPANLTRGRQRWQIYAINDTWVVLRSREGGPDGFLGTMKSDNEETPGGTRPHMIRGNVSDDSIYWKVSPWGDGTFFLSNKANKTDWHLNKKGDGILAMDSNTTLPQNGQRWSFDPITDIQMAKFSTVDLPNSTVDAPASITGTDPSNPTGTTNSSDSASGSSGSGGLSSGAKAAIGGSIGGVALIALVVLGLFFWRRRKQQSPALENYAEAPAHETTPTTKYAYEMQHDDVVKHEMPQPQFVELPQNARPAELPSEPVGYNTR